MRKTLAVLLVLALLTGLAPSAFAAGSASFSGPGVVRAGDTITLTFYAGGGIYGGSGSVSYDPSQLTLQSYSASIGGSWVVEFSGNNFVFYDNSMASPITGSAAIFNATFLVRADLPAGTGIAVSVNGVTLSDGQQDTSIGTRTFSASIAPPLSDNCRLSALTVSNASISPAFSPDVTSYTASVPYDISSLNISAVAEHAAAQVLVTSPGLAPGGTTSITVTVTAENGATRVYTIRVTRAQDPNYVPSNNSRLKELTVDGYQLSPAFSPEVQQYYVWLPYETSAITVNAAAEDPKAAAAVAQTGELAPGRGTDILVTVTAEDGTQLIYRVTAVRAPSHEDTPGYLNGERAEETQPSTVPETVPETEPATTAAAEPTEKKVEAPKGGNPALTVVVGLLSAVAGAAIALFVVYLIKKKQMKMEVSSDE